MNLGKFLTLPVFLALFGVLFLFVGAQRLWQAGSQPKKGEAILWGGIGLAIGAAFIAAALWFLGGPGRIERTGPVSPPATRALP